MAKEVLLSERPSGNNAMPSVDPPGGLGNFKGVMLCNRPSEDGPRSDPVSAFRAGVVHEQIGLCPTEKGPQVKGPQKPKNEAVKKHVAWLRQLQATMAAERREAEEEIQDEEERKKRISEQAARYRDAVHGMKVKQEDKLRKANQSRPKPMWAMTENQAEEAEEEDCEDLLNWAEGLDAEAFIHDIDFREALEVAKDRAGRLDKEQELFKQSLVHEFNDSDDEDGKSLAGSSATSEARERAARKAKAKKEGQDWDASTATSEAPSVNSEARSMAEQVMDRNSKIRGVHSKASVAKIIEKQEVPEGVPADIYEALKQGHAIPAPLITTHPIDARAEKPVDPSKLPFLYRYPGV